MPRLFAFLLPLLLAGCASPSWDAPNVLDRLQIADMAYGNARGGSGGSGGGGSWSGDDLTLDTVYGALDLAVSGGEGATSTPGGDLSLTGGSQTGSADAGDITMLGGLATAGAGGDVTIRGGTFISSGTNGVVAIGDANTSAVNIGASGITTTFTGTTNASITDGTLSCATVLVSSSAQLTDNALGWYGAGLDAHLGWRTSQTNNALVLGIQGGSAAQGGALLIMEGSHTGSNYAFPAQTDPHLVIFSATSAATDTGEFLALSHGKINAGTLSSDQATTDLLVTAEDSVPLSTATNLTGSNLILAGGLGTKDTEVIDYTQTGYTVVVTVNGSATTLTEGVDWTNVTSNAVSAAALATPLSAISGVSATVNAGAVVDITPDAGTYSLSVSETGTGNTATNGADGSVVSATPAVASYYWSSTAATANETDTPIKAAGTTTSLQADGFTVATTNRATYTGTTTRKFLVTVTTSVSTSAASLPKLLLAEGGTPITGFEISRTTSNTNVGAWALSGIVEFATNDYVEVWCETNDGDDITIESGTVTITGLP